MKPKPLPVKAAAEYAGQSQYILRQEHKRGNLEAVCFNKQSLKPRLYFTVAALDAWLAASVVRPVPSQPKPKRRKKSSATSSRLQVYEE